MNAKLINTVIGVGKFIIDNWTILFLGAFMFIIIRIVVKIIENIHEKEEYKKNYKSNYQSWYKYRKEKYNDVITTKEILKPSKSEEISKQIKEDDANFSKDDFINFVKDVFSRIAYDISHNKYEQIRNFTIEEVFSIYKKVIDDNISKKQIRHIEQIEYPYCALVEYSIESDKEILQVELHTIYRDYTKNNQGNIEEGMPYKIWNERYLLTFIRKFGIDNEKEKFSDKIKCPNCGAITNINHIGKCEFCNSIISIGKYDWVLAEINKAYE